MYFVKKKRKKCILCRRRRQLMNRSHLHSLSKSLHPQLFVADGCPILSLVLLEVKSFSFPLVPVAQVGLKLFLKLGNGTSTLFLGLEHLLS